MNWYEDEVCALERTVVQSANGTRPPVFYGSSSIRLWDTLATDLAGEPGILNLGFGGSTLEACNYFFERLVTPVHPRSLLVYAGDNDLGDGRSVEQLIGWFRMLARKVSDLPGNVPFGFISIKPSPARAGILDRIRFVNDFVRVEMQRRAAGFYVDVYAEMIDGQGRPRGDFFSGDGLHMNRDGYKLWTRVLEPYRNQIFTR